MVQAVKDQKGLQPLLTLGNTTRLVLYTPITLLMSSLRQKTCWDRSFFQTKPPHFLDIFVFFETAMFGKFQNKWRLRLVAAGLVVDYDKAPIVRTYYNTFLYQTGGIKHLCLTIGVGISGHHSLQQSCQTCYRSRVKSINFWKYMKCPQGQR